MLPPRWRCPSSMGPVNITKENVKDRAEILADQYRKKAQLHVHNVVLSPLGDDFRWTLDAEWNAQYDNYKILFEYMNSQPEWNINVCLSIFKFECCFLSYN